MAKKRTVGQSLSIRNRQDSMRLVASWGIYYVQNEIYDTYPCRIMSCQRHQEYLLLICNRNMSDSKLCTIYEIYGVRQLQLTGVRSFVRDFSSATTQRMK